MANFKENIQTFRAGEDLSALQNRAVKYGTDKETVVKCGAGERAIGIVLNAPGSGDMAEVALFGGGAKATAGAAFGIGKFLKSDANGKLIKGTTAGDYCVAMAMEAATADGDKVAVFVTPVIIAATE